MTTERWTDQMLDKLASKVDSNTVAIRELITLATQQQTNFNLMQTQILTMQNQVVTMQAEVTAIWQRLDADTRN